MEWLASVRSYFKAWNMAVLIDIPSRLLPDDFIRNTTGLENDPRNLR